MVIRVNELCVLVRLRVNELYVVVRVNELYVNELCIAVRVNEQCVVVRVNELCMVASEIRHPHVSFVRQIIKTVCICFIFSPVELPPFILSSRSPFLYSFFQFSGEDILC